MIQKIATSSVFMLSMFFTTRSYSNTTTEVDKEANTNESVHRSNDQLNSNLSIIQLGLGLAQFQDKATSPLIYSGLHINTGLGRSWMLKNANELNAMLNVGFSLIATNPPLQIISTVNNAYAVNGQVSLGYLHTLIGNSQSKFIVKAGAKADSWLDFRINTNHMNNTLGYDIIANLMASGKAVYTYQRKNKQKAIFATMHIGVINLNNRPGYNYSTTVPLISDEHTKDEQLNRKWKMNGTRLQTEIGIVSNKFKGYSQAYSYVFEGIKAPGRFEPFGFATHHIKYTLYLKRNK